MQIRNFTLAVIIVTLERCNIGGGFAVTAKRNSVTHEIMSRIIREAQRKCLHYTTDTTTPVKKTTLGGFLRPPRQILLPRYLYTLANIRWISPNPQAPKYVTFSLFLESPVNDFSFRILKIRSFPGSENTGQANVGKWRHFGPMTRWFGIIFEYFKSFGESR